MEDAKSKGCAAASPREKSGVRPRDHFKLCHGLIVAPYLVVVNVRKARIRARGGLGRKLRLIRRADLLRTSALHEFLGERRDALRIRVALAWLRWHLLRFSRHECPCSARDARKSQYRLRQEPVVPIESNSCSANPTIRPLSRPLFGMHECQDMHDAYRPHHRRSQIRQYIRVRADNPPARSALGRRETPALHRVPSLWVGDGPDSCRAGYIGENLAKCASLFLEAVDSSRHPVVDPVGNH